MWKIPQAERLQIAKKFKYFTIKTFLFWFVVLHECLLSVERERERDCFTETSTALVSPVLDQYQSVYLSCHSRAFGKGVLQEDVWENVLDPLTCRFFLCCSPWSSYRRETGRKLSTAVMAGFPGKHAAHYSTNVEDLILHPAESHCKWWRFHGQTLPQKHPWPGDEQRRA